MILTSVRYTKGSCIAVVVDLLTLTALVIVSDMAGGLLATTYACKVPGSYRHYFSSAWYFRVHIARRVLSNEITACQLERKCEIYHIRDSANIHFHLLLRVDWPAVCLQSGDKKHTSGNKQQGTIIREQRERDIF